MQHVVIQLLKWTAGQDEPGWVGREKVIITDAAFKSPMECIVNVITDQEDLLVHMEWLPHSGSAQDIGPLWNGKLC